MSPADFTRLDVTVVFKIVQSILPMIECGEVASERARQPHGRSASIWYLLSVVKAGID